MKYLVLILFAILISCDYPLLEIQHDGDTIHGTSIPTDTIINPIDTTQQQSDSCMSYVELVNTKVSTWAINLDGLPTPTYQFFYKPAETFIPIDIDSFFNQAGGDSKTYFSGINVFGIVTGIDNPSWVMQHSLYMLDQFGSLYLIYLNPYNFSTRGALKFYQFFDEIVLHSNVKRIDFWNTAYECEQYLQVIDYFINNCIDGHGKIFDIRHIPMSCPIDAERIAKLKLAGFTILPQQFNAPPPYIRA